MTEEKSSGCLKYILIGGIAAAILLVVGGAVAFFAAKSFISGMTSKYTETSPRQLPVPAISQQEADAVIRRADEFAKAVEEDRPAPELVFSAKDINVLINKHPDLKKVAGMISVEIDGDRIGGQLSIPLGELSGMFKGRYLNGSAVFSASVQDGRLVVFADSIEVKGEKLPESFMKSLSSGNLAEEANNDPKIAEILRKIESLSVRDGAVHIVPKDKLQQ